jgi:hypothetical protein
MTRNPPPVLFCCDCGARLIKHHFVIIRKDDSSYGAFQSWVKGVPARCVYDGVHEEEAKAKRRVAR